MGPSLPPSHCLVGAAMAAPTGADQACRAAESRRPKIRYRIQASSVTPAEPSIVCTEEEANSRMQAISAPMPSSRSHVDGRRSRVPITRLRRSEEHTSELQSLMRISYAVFCLKKKIKKNKTNNKQQH